MRPTSGFPCATLGATLVAARGPSRLACSAESVLHCALSFWRHLLAFLGLLSGPSYASAWSLLGAPWATLGPPLGASLGELFGCSWVPRWPCLGLRLRCAWARFRAARPWDLTIPGLVSQFLDSCSVCCMIVYWLVLCSVGLRSVAVVVIGLRCVGLHCNVVLCMCVANLFV